MPAPRLDSPAPSLRVPLALVALAFAAHVVRFGYSYGDGDQDELVPAALALLDPSLFTRDWLVQHVASGVNVRTAFVGLLAGLGAVLPMPTAAFVLHALTFAATTAGVFALAVTLTQSRTAATLGTLAALTVTTVMTLGGNAVVYPSAVPEGVAWALALPAFVLFLQKRWLVAGALLGAAAWFHLLAGGLTALALGLVGLWRAAERAPGYGLRASLVFGAAFVVAALPIAGPVLAEQWASPADPAGPDPFFVHAVFRNPHHHLFSTFGLGRHLRFWPLMGAGPLLLAWLVRRGRASFAPEVVQFWAVAFVAGLVAVVCVDRLSIEAVAKLQLFKLTVPSALLATLLVAGAVVEALPVRLRERVEARKTRRAAQFAAVLVALAVAVLAARGIGRAGARIGPIQHAQTPLAEVEAWARTATPKSALFATPPTVGSFRSHARRAVVANWYAFAFGDRAMQTWYRRLMSVAPIQPPPRGADAKPALERAYAARTAADWQALRRQFGVDYVLVRAGDAPLPFPVAYRNAGWAVHRLGARP